MLLRAEGRLAGEPVPLLPPVPRRLHQGMAEQVEGVPNVQAIDRQAPVMRSWIVVGSCWRIFYSIMKEARQESAKHKLFTSKMSTDDEDKVPPQ